MPGRPRSKAQKIRDRKLIAELYLQCVPQAEIASRLGIDQATVSRDLAYLYNAWQQDAMLAIDAIKARELAKCDQYEREAQEAWERSKHPAETELKEMWENADVSEGNDGKEQKTGKRRYHTKTTSTGQVGDPRFLHEIGVWMDRRREILGYAAPEKLALTDPTGEKEYAGGLTDEQRADRIAALLERARTRRTGQPAGGDEELVSPGRPTD